ncbi:hypothetical protein JCM8547_009300 [Rhodosporidiobolus lusitaniae]
MFSPRYSQPPFDDIYSSPYSTTHATPSSSHLYQLELERLAYAAARQQEVDEERHRQAQAAAYLEEQQRRRRQAVFEQAVREEAERRLRLEQVVAYRAALVRQAQEKEQARRQLAAVAAARRRQAAEVAVAREQCRRRAAVAAAEEDRRRRILEARRQRQAAVEPITSSFLDLLFGLQDLQQQQPEPAKVHPAPPAKQTTSPARLPSTDPAPDFPNFLDFLFKGLQLPTDHEEADPELAQEKPAPSSAPAVEQPSSPAMAPVEQPTPVPASSAPVDFFALEDAATVLQRRFRRHAARRAALNSLSSLTFDFESHQSSFTTPSSFTFRPSIPSTPSSDGSRAPTPLLAFGSPNASFLSYDNYLVQLLSKIDAVQSGGDRVVKGARKELGKHVEEELARLDGMKERAWEEQSQKSASVEEEKQEISVSVKPKVAQKSLSPAESSPTESSPAEQSCSIATSAPIEDTGSAFRSDAAFGTPASAAAAAAAEVDESSPLADSTPPPTSFIGASAINDAVERSTTSSPVEAVESTPSSAPAESSTTTPPSSTKLTCAAVAALPPSSPTFTSSPSRADDTPARPASRASTRSVSSDESAEFHEYVADVVRRARELGEEVSRLEADEREKDEQVEEQKVEVKKKVEQPVEPEVAQQDKEEIGAPQPAEESVEQAAEEKAELSEAEVEEFVVV